MAKKKREKSSLGDSRYSVNSESPRVRKECSCEATKHPLINNCLRCGRIVCALEGSGPCFTCSSLVCTSEEEKVLSSDTAAGEALRKKLMGEDFSLKFVGKMVFGTDYKEEASKAIMHKNKLLEFDRTARQQTKVIDDQVDHYSFESNKWLSKEQKKILQQKHEEAHEARHDRKNTSQFTIDFAGRKIEEEQQSSDVSFDVEKFLEGDESIYEYADVDQSDIIFGYRPQYCGAKSSFRRPLVVDQKKEQLRIQDGELQCMSDDGMCLSVHQPYASLIIAGIKKHEGRHWYTSFRGRLWIHASAHVPLTNDIAVAESVYKTNAGVLEFPKTFPTGCLLGCIELTDCLSQEEYITRFPTGECGSLFVLICENPQELKVKIPMRGRKQIFKLEPKIHRAVKNTLQKLK